MQDDGFRECAEEAKLDALVHPGEVVEFSFNNVTYVVDADTNIDRVVAAHQLAILMGRDKFSDPSYPLGIFATFLASFGSEKWEILLGALDIVNQDNFEFIKKILALHPPINTQ